MRAKGYYWVRFRGNLTVAYHYADISDQRSWEIIGSDNGFWFKDFDWISDKPIPEPYIPVPSDGPKQVFGEDLDD